ncbi:SPRY domain-containing protein [Ditylenchus destructor]|nr:SPRY domain-containing protein [Ditylenchus destructor]
MKMEQDPQWQCRNVTDPKPTHLDMDKKSTQLTLSDNNLVAKFEAGEIKKLCLRSNVPIPRSAGIYYFEVSILDMDGRNARVGIGFAERHSSRYSLPGEQFDSYGLGTDGDFMCHGRTKIIEKVAKLTTLGCGIDFKYGRIYFTKNKRIIEKSIGIPMDYELFAAVGIAGHLKVEVNFGQSPFKCKIDVYKQYAEGMATNWINRPQFPPPRDEFTAALNDSELASQIAQYTLLEMFQNISMPTYWSLKNRRRCLLVSECGRSVIYQGAGKYDEDAATILANCPIPAECKIYYFEIQIIFKGRKGAEIDPGTIAIGLCYGDVSLSDMPGLNDKSVGYHGDHGKFYCNGDWDGTTYGPPFSSYTSIGKAGDIVGCWIDFEKQEHFYTKNGRQLGNAPKWLANNGNLFPAVGMISKEAEIYANFGQIPFAFDIENCMKKRQQSSSLTQQGVQRPEMSTLKIEPKSPAKEPSTSAKRGRKPKNGSKLDLDGGYFENVPCTICKSSRDSSQMAICKRCDSLRHVYCLNPQLKSVPMSWLCNTCENYDPVISEIPVFPEVSPLELATRIHPVKVLKPSIKTYYKPLDPKIKKDHKLPDFFESRKTDDLFANTTVENESSTTATKGKHNSLSRAGSCTRDAPAKTPCSVKISTAAKRKMLDEAATPESKVFSVFKTISESLSPPAPTNVMPLRRVFCDDFTQTDVAAHCTISTQTEQDPTTYNPAVINPAPGPSESIGMQTDQEVHSYKSLLELMNQEMWIKCREIDNYILARDFRGAVSKLDDEVDVFDESPEIRLLLELYDFAEEINKHYQAQAGLRKPKVEITESDEESFPNQAKNEESATYGSSEYYHKLKTIGESLKRKLNKLKQERGGELHKTLANAETEAFDLYWTPDKCIDESSYLLKRSQHKKLSDYILTAVIFRPSRLAKGLETVDRPA